MKLDFAAQLAFTGFTLDAAFQSDARVTALFGRSGSGKSTIIRLMAGLAHTERGHFRVNGRSLFDAESRVFVATHRRRVGLVMQKPLLFPHLSVERNLRYGEAFATATPAINFAQALDLLDLHGLLDRKPATLSGGEQQRVAIGRALLAAPELLLLDEPLSALDAARRGEVLAYLRRLRDANVVPMVYVSHALDEVLKLADNMVVIDEGRVVASGTPHDLLARRDLRPLSGRFDASAVVDCKVTAHDERSRLTQLSFEGGELWVSKLGAHVGDAVTIRIRARDVMLSLVRPVDTSILNVIPVVVTDIGDPNDAVADVTLEANGVRLFARITRRAVDQMALRPGMNVFALVRGIWRDR